MISRDVVLQVLLLQAVVIALTLLVVFGHAIWYRRASSRRAALLEQGRDALVAVLSSGDVDRLPDVLVTMPRRELIRLLTDIAPSLAGPHRDMIVQLAARLGLSGAATRWLRSPFWWRRLHGARLLTLVGRDASTLAGLAADPHPLVRAQRAEALGRHPSPGGAEELISMLGDESGHVRYTARESLMLLRAGAQPAIVHALEQEAPADLLALLEVAAAIGSVDGLAVGLRHSHSEDPQARVRAARLLRAIGAPDAATRLVELLEDASPLVRATAATAIGTIAHWPGALALSRRLDDVDWEVRTTSSVALQRLGAPGELLLRRARDAEAGPGADAARQVLEAAERLRLPVAR